MCELEDRMNMLYALIERAEEILFSGNLGLKLFELVVYGLFCLDLGFNLLLLCDLGTFSHVNDDYCYSLSIF